MNTFARREIEFSFGSKIAVGALALVLVAKLPLTSAQTPPAKPATAPSGTSSAAEVWKDLASRAYNTPRRAGESLIIFNFVKEWKEFKENEPHPGPVLRSASPGVSSLPSKSPSIIVPKINKYYDEWARNPALARAELQRRLNEYRSQSDVLENSANFRTAPKTFEYIRIASGFGGDKIGTGISLGATVIEDVLDSTVGPAEQMRLQDEAAKYLDLHSKAITTIYDEGAKDNLLRDFVLNPVMQTDTRARIGESAQEMLDRNMEVRAQRQAEIAQKLSQEANENSRQSLLQTKRILALQERIDRKLIQLMKNGGMVNLNDDEIAQLKEEILSESLEQTKAAIKAQMAPDKGQENPEITKLRYEAWSETVRAMGNLIGLADPQAGRVVSQFGSQVIEFSKALDAARLLGKTDGFLGGLMQVAAGSNFLFGIVGLFSFGPNLDEQIYEQIVELRKDLAEVRKEMHLRFDVVDKKLDQIYVVLVNEFYELRKDARDMKRDLFVIRQSVNQTQRQLDRMHYDLSAEIKAISDQLLAEKIVAATKAITQWDHKIDEAEFIRCMTAFQQGAVYESAAPLVDQAQDALYLPVRWVGKSLSGDDVYRELNDLAQIGQTFGFPDLLAPSVISESLVLYARKGPVHPRRWAYSTNLFVTTALLYRDVFLGKYRTEVQGGGRTAIDEIEASGRRIDEFTNRIVSVASPVPGEKRIPNVASFRLLFRNYCEALRALSEKSAEVRNVKLRETNLGYDPLLSARQPDPNLKTFETDQMRTASWASYASYAARPPSPIPFFGITNAAVSTGPYLVATDNGFRHLVPSEYLAAHMLGIGKVTFQSLGHAPYADNGVQKRRWMVAVIYTDPKNTDARDKVGRVVALRQASFTDEELKKFVADGGHTGKYELELETILWDKVVKPRFPDSNITKPMAATEPEAANPIYAKHLARLEPPSPTVTDDVQGRWKEVHQKVSGVLLAELQGGTLKDLGDIVTGARELLCGYMTLGWNKSMRDNPLLRSLFQGDEALPMKDHLIEDLRAAETHFENALPVAAGKMLEASFLQRTTSIDVAQIRYKLKDPKFAILSADLGTLVSTNTDAGLAGEFQILKKQEAQAEYYQALHSFTADYLNDEEFLADSGITTQEIEFRVRPAVAAKALSLDVLLVLRLAALHKTLFEQLLTADSVGEVHPEVERAQFVLALLKKFVAEAKPRTAAVIEKQ